MPRKTVPPRIVLLLTGLALVLFLTVAVILVVAAVLGAMGDEVGRRVLHGVALGCGIPLAVDLICLLLALGVNSFSETDPPEAE